MRTPGDRIRAAQKAAERAEKARKHAAWLKRHPNNPEAVKLAEEAFEKKRAAAEKKDAVLARKLARFNRVPPFSREVALRNFVLDCSDPCGLRALRGASILATQAQRHRHAGPNWKCYAEGTSAHAKWVLNVLLKAADQTNL